MAQTSPAARSDGLFRDRILPLLEDRCFPCHGKGDELEGGLDLTTRAAMLKGGETGPALVPGKPEESRMYQAVLRTGELVMPPKENAALDEQQTAALKTWIASGAPWDEVPAQLTAPADGWSNLDGVLVATSGGLSDSWTNRRYAPDDIWAYQPVRRQSVPWDALGDALDRHPIDAFIVHKLKEQGFDSLAAPADRRTLLRRATFDLHGLPPDPDETAGFLADDSPQAYDRLLDRLLASEHYGEQLARHWLDVVRYADTSGYSNDYERPNAWRYRDYVVRSFNADKRFDRFIVEQLAGDELLVGRTSRSARPPVPLNSPDSAPSSNSGNETGGPGSPPYGAADDELLIAAGFLRMGPWEHTGMSVAAVTRQEFLDDVTNSVGVTFLGQGLRCCRCHDHKFDPLPTRDYYRLQACFAPAQFVDRDVPFLPDENIREFDDRKARIERLLADSRAAARAIRDKSDAAVAELLRERGVAKLDDLPGGERPQRFRYGLSKLELSLEKIYAKRISYFERELLRYEPLAFSVYSGPANGYTSNQAVFRMPGPAKREGAVEVVHILGGGALDSPLEPVTPGVLSAVGRTSKSARATAPVNSHNGTTTPEASGVDTGGLGSPPCGDDDETLIPDEPHGRRLALARWIAAPHNPLTARVIVNRVWQRHFGAGLVATPNNFGKMGAKPSHPELLDWLATWFVEHGWSLKQLDRLIMTSQTYRQSSDRPDLPQLRDVDAPNRLLAHFPPRRLAAEELRDSLLAITGELSREMGGPGVFPEINREVALQPRHIMGSVAPAYQPSPTPGERNRRTIYAFRYRTLPDPLLEVFNRPGSETSCERRDETTVTPQVFALFNGQFVHDRALALAARIGGQSAEVATQVELAFRAVLGRIPEAEERTLAVSHVRQMREYHQAHVPVRVELPRSVEREMVEELTGETVRWTEELVGMDGYVPDVKPWDVEPPVRALAELCLVLMNSNEFAYVR
jgi:hypothetical protein